MLAVPPHGCGSRRDLEALATISKRVLKRFKPVASRRLDIG